MKITEEFFLSSRREILEGRMFDEEEIKEDPSTYLLGINYAVLYLF